MRASIKRSGERHNLTHENQYLTSFTNTIMKGPIFSALLYALLVKSGQTEDQCNAVGKVDEMYTKLKGQLQEAKDHLQRAAGDLDQWQNITTDLFQQRTAGCCPSTTTIGTLEHPAESCGEIANKQPSSLPGYNWVLNQTGSANLVYCTVSTQCCDTGGGWMRIAHLDMTDRHQSCPPSFRQISAPERACGRTTTSGGCNSVSFLSRGIQYRKVCGRIIGFQDGSTSGFFTPSTGNDIDSAYIDGISLTHGQNPRKHVWSFANALQERLGYGSNQHICPCTNPASTMAQYIPGFVGNDYFCDAGTATTGLVRTLYTDDPLWDGQGCGEESTCCTFNKPPWFCKTLPQPTADDIEVRVCADERYTNEDSPFQLIEIYVQ